MPDMDKTGPDGKGCRHHEGGHRHGHEEGGQCCGGRRHRHDEAPLTREEEIAYLERVIADSEARLFELRGS